MSTHISLAIGFILLQPHEINIKKRGAETSCTWKKNVHEIFYPPHDDGGVYKEMRQLREKSGETRMLEKLM